MFNVVKNTTHHLIQSKLMLLLMRLWRWWEAGGKKEPQKVIDKQ